MGDSQLINLISVIICRVVINADAPYIKMVSEQFDRCHGTLLQYVEFLCSAVTPAAAYAQLIPSLDDLVHVYHLDPEVCLDLCQSMCSFLLSLHHFRGLGTCDMVSCKEQGNIM